MKIRSRFECVSLPSLFAFSECCYSGFSEPFTFLAAGESEMENINVYN